jgi:hypothetical protein
MAKKGYKSQRNQPEMYKEVKKPISLALTPTAKEILRSFAITQEISQSEFVERLLRKTKSANDILISCVYPLTNTN